MSEIEKYYNGEIIVDFEEETELEKKYNEVAKERNKLYKQLQQKENIIKEVREYIEKVETLAMIDKVNIFSISTLKMILDKDKV